MKYSIAESNGLWSPADLSDLLTVCVDHDADSETVKGMLEINGAGSQWLKGEIPGDYYFDLLDHHGIDPLEFVGDVFDHVELLLRQ